MNSNVNEMNELEDIVKRASSIVKRNYHATDGEPVWLDTISIPCAFGDHYVDVRCVTWDSQFEEIAVEFDNDNELLLSELYDREIQEICEEIIKKKGE